MPEEQVPEHAKQILHAYNEHHQIAAFLQDMMTSLFMHAPVDPYDFMLEYVARHRPGAPPKFSSLWVRTGNNKLPEDWHLRRCWLTKDGVLCIVDATDEKPTEEDAG
eukprot:TRINITY_DN23828_c0_g1_i1.p2 TRINITY_DN23828_c0_g1~~TRINITY_DN23828_c0_g1_i1.p2  ORF type:complete len:107 (+),score=23.80 TRINITY_DN23828_c0_g1_i1:49-369(+)